jgi:hypothetical protein
MPYQEQVALVLSVLWWGFYLGCLGLSIGGLVGLWAEQATAAASGSSDSTASREQTDRPDVLTRSGSSSS